MPLANNPNWQTVVYDINASPNDAGHSLYLKSTTRWCNVTLNEDGLYLVLANSGLRKPTNNTRTSYLQRLTLGGVEVAGSVTTTY